MMQFVIVVDTQKDFMAPDGALTVSGADALLEPMRDWLQTLTPETAAGVLFTFDTHEPEVYAGSDESEFFPLHCARGSDGWANLLDVAHLDPAIPAWRLEKGVFDMWTEEGLMIEDARDSAAESVHRDHFFEFLKTRQVETVTVIGVAADYCVRWAIEGLVARGFGVTVPEHLTRGIDRQIEQVVREEFGNLPVQLTHLAGS